MATLGKWVQAPGLLKEISVGTRQYIWGVNPSNMVHNVVGGSAFWAYVPGGLSWVSAGADGSVWGVNPAGNIFRRDGAAWTQIPGTLATISVGKADNVWGLQASGSIFRWNGSGWAPVDGTLANISVASDGTVWGVQASGNIFRWNGSGWVQVPGVLSSVSCGSATHIWGLQASGTIFRWTNGDWEPIPGASFTNIDVGADGTVWGVTSTGSVFHFLYQEPLLVSSPHLGEKQLEPAESALYTFTVTNVSTGSTASNISLKPLYDASFFSANGITISGLPITIASLAPGQSATPTFTIATKEATVGPYGFYGVDATYTLTTPGNTISINSTGGWMSFQVVED